MHPINLKSLIYWMEERERVREKKEAGEPKPWSEDEVFQSVYFCNVDRENDKVTKFIRQMYSPHVGHPFFTHNIILSRFLNWPLTLGDVGYLYSWEPDDVKMTLNNIKDRGEKVWGNAYVVSTCGRQMDKIDYLTEIVMPSIERVLKLPDGHSCESEAIKLQLIEGISTFMAGQVVADLKNTEGHPLREAPDWGTFALPGPGSRRGMDWVYGEKLSERDWYSAIASLHDLVYTEGWRICRQNLQNCLCEYDKWCRVTNGTGRSKRKYNGT